MLRATLLLLLLLLRCPRGGRAEVGGGGLEGLEGLGIVGPCPPAPRTSAGQGRAGSPQPSLVAGEPCLPRPLQVRFQAETFHHVLRWEPDDEEPPGARYEVQYKRYGHPNWTAASHCANTASRSCDLTPQTLSPQQRYTARVRTMMGNRTSSWSQTPHFSPKEATLWLANVSLAVTSNTIRMTLQLPVNRWGNITYEDIHGQWLEFHVCVRRTSDGHQFVYVGTSLEFDLPPLLWGERYCVSVEPHVVSQPSPGNRTEEQCLSIPSAEDQARTVILPSLTLLSLAALGTLGTAWTWVYVKKPMKTPLVLKSLLRSSSPWRPNGLPALGMKDVVLCVEAESIQHLSLSPENCTTANGLHCHSARAAPPPPEKSLWLATLWTGGELKSLGLQGMEDSSSCSMDSGICLQEDSGSPSHFLNCRRPSLGSSKMGEGVQIDGDFCTEMGLMLPPVALFRKMDELALGTEGRQNPPKVLFAGYQKQLGSSQALPNTDKMSHSQPAFASGYLKQPSFAAPSGLGDTTHSQDIPSRTPQFAAMSPCVLWPLGLP